MFLIEGNVVPPPMPHVLPFLVCLLPIKCAVGWLVGWLKFPTVGNGSDL
jgi:hypothetical protein